MMRRLTRSALFAVTLAYVLALAGMAGARVMSAHAGEVHAFAALKVICSEHGLAAPVGEPVDHNHSDCPCGPGCAFKTFSATARDSVIQVWSPADVTSVFYSTTSFLPVGSRAPPDLTARGPPILI